MRLDADEITGEFSNAPATSNGNLKFRTVLPQGVSSDFQFLNWLTQNRGIAKITATNNQNLFIQVILPFIPWLLIFGFIWFFVFRQLRNCAGAGGMLGNFGRSRHKITSKEHTNVTFDDVAGIEEAKEEVMEIVEFLKNPKKFQRLGGRIPRGVLLVGEPGTGKTLLAKAIAGEADVPFFSISRLRLRRDVRRRRRIAASATCSSRPRTTAPCIIFLDEIDAVGRRRGSGFSLRRARRARADAQRDPRRDGRLRHQRPGDRRRRDQPRGRARPRPHPPGPIRPADLRAAARREGPHGDPQGPQPQGEARAQRRPAAPRPRPRPASAAPTWPRSSTSRRLGATLAGKEFIEQDDLEEARDKVRFGRASKSRVIDEKEKIATAYHEAGHAVVQYLLRPDADPIHKVTIIPRGSCGGATMTPAGEGPLQLLQASGASRSSRSRFAGRIAEEMFTGDINTGACGDIRQATGIARKMVRDWGMNDRLGFVFYGEDDNKPELLRRSATAASTPRRPPRSIDEEVKKLIDSSTTRPASSSKPTATASRRSPRR